MPLGRRNSGMRRPARLLRRAGLEDGDGVPFLAIPQLRSAQPDRNRRRHTLGLWEGKARIWGIFARPAPVGYIALQAAMATGALFWPERSVPRTAPLGTDRPQIPGRLFFLLRDLTAHHIPSRRARMKTGISIDGQPSTHLASCIADICRPLLPPALECSPGQLLEVAFPLLRRLLGHLHPV